MPHEDDETLAVRFAVKVGEPRVAVVGEVGRGTLQVLRVDFLKHVLDPIGHRTLCHYACYAFSIFLILWLKNQLVVSEHFYIKFPVERNYLSE